MRRRSTLPLGIDAGTARVRVALAERADDGTVHVTAVAVRERTADLGVTLANAVDELDTTERRCAFALGVADAYVLAAALPKMPRGDMERAGRFEAARLCPIPPREATVRVVAFEPAGTGAAIGIARTERIAELVHAARSARLRPHAVEFGPFALARGLHAADAVLDIGRDASALVILGGKLPLVFRFAVGGAAFTDAVATSLGIDAERAEARKRAHGLGGSAAATRESLVAGVATALVDVRANVGIGVRALSLTGNGARLIGLADALAAATAIPTAFATLRAMSPDFAPDLLRAAAPDWALAVGAAGGVAAR